MIPLGEHHKQSRWIELFDPTLYVPILDSLLLHLTIADVLILCQACKGLNTLKDYILRHVGDVDERLKNFVNDPALLRSKLGQHNALVSGAFARSLFEWKPIKVLHLDVFINDGVSAEKLAEYLEDHENYNVENEENGTVGLANQISEATLLYILTTTKASRLVTYMNSSRLGVKLRINRTRSTPIQHILLSSYTTACVNIMTWNKAYSVFPLHTLVKHRFYPLKSFDDGFGSRLSELAQQGWTTRDIIWPDLEDTKSSTVTRLRRVGDGFSLIIPLNTGAVRPPSTPDFIINYAQFVVKKNSPPSSQVQPTPFGPPLRGSTPKRFNLSLQANEVKSPGARYTYTAGSGSWSSYVNERLRRWAWLETYKMGTEGAAWLSPALHPITSQIPDFEKPETWDYADDQIPNWYREWAM